MLIGVDHRVRGGALGHERDERRAVGCGHDGCGDLAGFTVLDTCDGDLANRPAAGVEALALVLVALLTADVRLVGLDWAGERGERHVGPCLADTVCEEPRRLLRDAEVAVQLH